MSAVSVRQSPRALVPRMRELRAEGHAAPAIGRMLGIPESTVRNWWNAGTCQRCGEPTERSSGPTTKHCTTCSHAIGREAKVWTREAIIDAIRRFAAANGRPPRAPEWVRGNAELRYPPFSQCYRGSNSPNAPFASWSDAIEAAGFPRPYVGKREGQQHWSRELLIERIRAAADGPLAPPVAAVGETVVTLCQHYFGGWPQAVAAAGLVRVPPPGGPLVRAHLKQEIADSRAREPEAASPTEGTGR